ncbi:hypothetical protein Scep_001448 [Stephania cephalantha]|uniref:Diacylglycerol O-acyltransferase n=1 Tax=Stephania cephalantha TaxID=152367 RepID=A0AAP0L7X8_9MAGN
MTPSFPQFKFCNEEAKTNQKKMVRHRIKPLSLSPLSSTDDSSSSSEVLDYEEPVTPAGRLFHRPEMEQVINCAVGVKNPIADAEAIKEEIKKSLMIKHPRFRSVLVRDKSGREHWRRLSHVDLDSHVFVRDVVGSSNRDDDDDDDDEETVNGYIANLCVSSSLSLDKPLWEFHVLRRQKCLVLRVHHSLGDGISLMSLFLACCRKADDPGEIPTIGPTPTQSSSSSRSSKTRPSLSMVSMLRWAWRAVMMGVLTLVFVLKFVGRALGVKDVKTCISGGDGVELLPRKLATAKFKLDDLKFVKNAVSNATINDVLFGVISSGLSRYLDLKSPNELQEGLEITGLAMVNLRKQPGLQELSKLMKDKSSSRWGNKFGFMMVPVYYHKHATRDPLEYVSKAKATIDRKKLSLEAHFTYILGYLAMTLLGPKVPACLNYRIICNTSFTISNIYGPQEEITCTGNPVTYLRVTSTSLAHAITMHMVSYAGNAEMQVLAAKDIIPEPKVLAKCFEEALLEMKSAAQSSTDSTLKQLPGH